MIEIQIREIIEGNDRPDAPPTIITRFLRTVDSANIPGVVYAIDAALCEPIAAPPAPQTPPATPTPRKRRKDAGVPRTPMLEPAPPDRVNIDAQLPLS